MFVTGGPGDRRGGGMPHRIVTSSVPLSVLRITGGGIIGKYAGHRRQVTDVVVDRTKEGDDRSLVGGDRIEIAHSPVGLGLNLRHAVEKRRII
jgi:hypothetical protein